MDGVADYSALLLQFRCTPVSNKNFLLPWHKNYMFSHRPLKEELFDTLEEYELATLV